MAASRPAVAAPASTAPAYRGPKVRLTIGPKAGKYLRIEQHQVVQTISPEVPAARGERKNWQSMTISGEMVIPPAEAGGVRRVSFTCRQVEQTIGLGGKVRKYSSAGPADEQDVGLLRQWGPLIGWRGARLLKPDGRSEKLEGVEGLLSRVPAGAKMAEQRETLRGLGGALLDGLAVGWWRPLVPSGAVGPGDSWQATVYVLDEPALGTVEVACRCVLQDIEESGGSRIAVIGFAGAAQVDARVVDRRLLGDLPVKVGLQEMKLELSGRLRFDVAGGLAVGVRRDLSGVGKMGVADAKGTRAGLKITFRSTRRQTLQASR